MAFDGGTTTTRTTTRRAAAATTTTTTTTTKITMAMAFNGEQHQQQKNINVSKS